MNTLATHLDADSYRDRKKALWTFAMLGALSPCIGPLASTWGYQSSFWYFVAPLMIYVMIPLGDYFLGEDTNNPPESAVPRLEQDRYYRFVVYMIVPVLWGVTIFNAMFLVTHDVSWYEWLATTLSTGTVMGLTLTVSHELGHKKEWLPRKVGLINSALCAYGHFSIEHNRGHHRHVATPEDPASSQMGESVYRFAFRELPGCFFRAWDLEEERLARMGKSAWSWGNEILQGWLVTAVVYGTLIYVYGASMVPVLAVVALWGAFQLTLANYVEHYGLTRQKVPGGRYERCEPHHSWNSNHIVSNLVMFHLQRHSDHHANPTRSYQSLRNFPDLPTLPAGYFAMFILALVPPAWFAVMDRRLIQAVNGDTKRINFLGGKRAALMRKFFPDSVSAN